MALPLDVFRLRPEADVYQDKRRIRRGERDSLELQEPRGLAGLLPSTLLRIWGHAFLRHSGSTRKQECSKCRLALLENTDKPNDSHTDKRGCSSQPSPLAQSSVSP